MSAESHSPQLATTGAAITETLVSRRPVRTNRWSSFRVIPRIETYASVVAFAQTIPGKLLLLAAFGSALSFYMRRGAVLFILFLALTAFLPNYRRSVIAALTAGFTLYASGDLRIAGWIAFTLLLGAFLFWCARKWPRSAFGRRPVFFLLTAFSGLICLAGLIPRNTWISLQLWQFVAFLSTYLWFIGYALLDRNADKARDLPFEIGTFRPFWGSTTTPFPKGAAYLRRIEARNAEQLAITQLKGLKLLLWAIVLSMLAKFWNQFWHVRLGVPTLATAIALSVSRAPAPQITCWISVLSAFFESVFAIAIMGHRIIAICRMAGFNALRNTYRPLSSVTVQEYFNRFYFYFKELLVDFFFYPTFLRYFRKYRRLRMVAATFAAATFGNAFYHFTRDWGLIYHSGLRAAFINFQVFLFYCLVLGAALSLSQLQTRLPRSGFKRIVSVCWVIVFYSLLNIFGSTERVYPLAEHFRFLGHLFYLSF